MLPLAAEQYERQRRLAGAAVVAVRREWGQVESDFDAGWAKVGPRIVRVVAAAKLGAARDGAAWVPYALAAQGQSADADAAVVPAALAAVTSQGNPLDALLYGAVVHAKSADVDSLAARVASGRSFLDMAVQTEVADAGRDAQQAAIVSRPRVMWVRVVNPPCCQRCALLAGRVYSHSDGFPRHPGCDCSMLPQTVANPHAAGVTIGLGDVKDLTARQRQLIADGKSFNQVINDYQRKRGDFLPPTRVARLSAGSRESAVESLTRAGYLAA